MRIPIFTLILIILSLLPSSLTQTTCPLNFTSLRRFARPSEVETRLACQYVLQGLRFVQSEYLLRTGSFLPPLDSAGSCWDSYQALADGYFTNNFDVRRSCGFETSWISRGCMNITTRAEFEAVVPQSARDSVVRACNRSLLDGSPCATCTRTLSNLPASYLRGSTIGNVSDCTAYPSIYIAAFGNYLGPEDKGTAKCLFSLGIAENRSGNDPNNTRKIVISVVVSVCGLGLLLLFGVFWLVSKRKRKTEALKSTKKNDNAFHSGLDAIEASTTLTRFTFDEIKDATQNFSRENLIGSGGFGNVYKGVLPDGTAVALKRFKNCSASGDASFIHEVEVIASIRHVNLVSLRGYCIATTPLEGHQRIIVCDLLKNGSLHDHLFGPIDSKMSWPVRQKIALGTAKGIDYLHHGARPAIIHRDIKASNILLDETFEPKLADFGLAKFNPEGFTHVSTRVAGTMGYLAPEYALYGQLTERSDVYSFGVVLLELLSGKKPILSVKDGDQPMLLTDWAWSMVREGKAMDVVEGEMLELEGCNEVVEKYVLVAVLCSHPQLYARPTMDQVVKMLDNVDVPLPSIPDRPISIIASADDIERSMSSGSGGSDRFSTRSGYQMRGSTWPNTSE